MIKALSAALAIALFAAPVAAQQQACFQLDYVVGILSEKLGMKKQMHGQVAEGIGFEIWANLSNGKWAMLLVNPAAGEACLRGEGNAFRLVGSGV